MIYIPLLHLRCRDVDTVCLTTTAHSEVDIQRREVVAQVTLGDDIERCRVVKDVIVEREVTAVEEALDDTFHRG